MKNILFLALCLCISQQSMAGRTFTQEKECPKNIICKENELLGDDGKCYSCEYSKGISIRCMGDNEVQHICPNRAFDVMMLDSYLNCPEYRELYSYNGKNICVTRCEDGYKRITPTECFDEKTGSKIVENY